MCGWQVKLCDPLVTHGPYLSAVYIKRCTNSSVYFLLLLCHLRPFVTLYERCQSPVASHNLRLSGNLSQLRVRHATTFFISSPLRPTVGAVGGAFLSGSSPLCFLPLPAPPPTLLLLLMMRQHCSVGALIAAICVC